MKILIVYGSLLGKTQRIAHIIGTLLYRESHKVEVKNVIDTQVNELNDYDLTILGCSTWDDGVLQFDFRPFHKELLKSKFVEKNFAVFALGSHNYPHPLTAGNILEATVRAMGGNLIVPVLKIDLDHDEPENFCDEEVLEWTNKLIEILNNPNSQNLHQQ